MTDDSDGQRAAKLEILKHHLTQHGALSAALVSFFQSALRTTLLLNGGAIVATLSVYGAKGHDIASSGGMFYIKGGLTCWVTGLVAAALSGGVIAWGQREFQVVAGDDFRRQAREFFGISLGNGEATACHALIGRLLRRLFIALWFVSVASFGGGAVFTIQAMI